MRVCKCGCNRFYAHQVQYHDIIITADGPFTFWEDQKPDSCYETETPYGPFVCEKCGAEYNELNDIPDVEDSKATIVV